MTQTFNIDNFIINGSLTKNGTSFSGFSTSNYLSVTDKFINNTWFLQPDYLFKDAYYLNDAESWEIFVKFTTGSIGSVRPIFGRSNSSYYCPQVLITSAGKIEFFISTNTSSWAYDVTGDYVLSANTTYYIKLEFTGTDYICTLYDESKTVLETLTRTDSTKTMSNANIRWGCNNSNSFNGSIDFGETYINKNGTLFWKPFQEIKIGSVEII